MDDEQQEYEKNTQAQVQAPSSSIAVDDQVAYEKILTELGSDKSQSSKYSHELSTILKWVKDKGVTDINDIVWEVRYLKTRLQSPSGMEDSVKHFYRYIYLLQEKASIDSELKRFDTVHG